MRITIALSALLLSLTATVMASSPICSPKKFEGLDGNLLQCGENYLTAKFCQDNCVCDRNSAMGITCGTKGLSCGKTQIESACKQQGSCVCLQPLPSKG
ncbi:hypothetical protein OHC33_003380 [Knufia fluminis]|uniref:Uncharacterized protein n=1 Tax=Knufia fluminis TaxID=191047 RepID=A0AAN8EH74_9EURO|nr:hypothetical protein OHC33_003380 [Knufia fluminis]